MKNLPRKIACSIPKMMDITGRAKTKLIIILLTVGLILPLER